MAATKKRATQPTPKAPGRPDAYILFSRMIANEQNANLVSQLTTFMRKGAKHVVVAISSPGGDVQAGFALYNMLRALQIHVTMHNIGVISSTANVVFVGGDTRLASTSASFSFHAPTVTLDAELNATDLRQHVRDLTIGERRTRLVLEERTRMTGARINALKRNAQTVDSAQAVELGLTSGIAEFTVPRGATVVTV